MIPNPVPEMEIQNPGEVKRKVLCAHYDRCLDVAVEKRWRGFSCSECMVFRKIDFSEVDWSEDALACRVLILKLSYLPMSRRTRRFQDYYKFAQARMHLYGIDALGS